jgi:Rps23 Pro-64 3,4-dihydroxylase Tpa1-like proline 4-hydroxylase
MEKIISGFINKNKFDFLVKACKDSPGSEASEENSLDELNEFNEIYKKTNIVTIPNFISDDVLQKIKNEIENYQWWTYAMIPNNNIWAIKYDDNLKEENAEECLLNLEKKNFSYRFRRSTNNHYNTCLCISCRLNETVGSNEVTDLLSKIVGVKKLSMGEGFLSNYSKDDFLSLHHDIKKGDIAVTFSLTYDWDPTYGGILHFCDENKNIYKSVVPRLGSVNIFKLDPENGIDHFVSCVNVNKSRYTYTVWYNIVL